MTVTLERKIVGSFAPPMNDAVIETYRQLSRKAPAPIADAMRILLDVVMKWWELPISGLKSSDHPSGKGQVIPLEESHKKALYDGIPWPHELAGMGGLFEKIDAEKDIDLRNAAFHLLWHVIELNNDREPICVKKIGDAFVHGHTDKLNAM